MQTANNNRLTMLLGQQGVEPGDFAVASLASLAGVLLILLQVQTEVPQISSWSMTLLVLTIVLFLIALSTYSNFKQSAEKHLLGLNFLSLLLLLVCGMSWGSLYGVLAEYQQPASTNKGFWISMLVTLSVAAVFRRQTAVQMLWVSMVYFPILFYIVGGHWQSGHDAIQVMLIMLVIIIFPVFFATKRKAQIEDPHDYEKLKKEYDDLRIAFAAQDSAIGAETALRQAVEESLREANRVAEAANRSKTEFMATVGHEIRTPLNGILPILEILSDTELDHEQKQLVHTASYSSRHLLRIINDVLDFSKAEVGKLEIENIELDLHELVYSITGLMKQAAEAKKLNLKVILSPELPRFVRGDSLRLKQIITNLLSNALKFTDKGSISLEVTLRHEHVKEVELMFTVRDTGIGMSEQTTGKLFRSFTQADASTTRTHGGTGLGLAICKRLVELMGGEIGVQSVLSRGSTFWFVLPMRKSLKDVPALREHVQDARILFYSNSEETPDELKLLQQECQISIEISQDLDDAIERVSRASRPGAKNFYDLVVIDAFGHEVAVTSELLSFRKYLQHSFTQVMVVNALPHHEQDFKAAGADAVLMRPFKAEIFRQRIYRLLDVGLGHVLDDVPEDGLILQDLLSVEEFSASSILDSQPDIDANSGHGGVVLLVEDNPVNLAVARRMLQMQGLKVEVAKDGQQALDVLQAKQYDLVFMDCQMPNMDGYEATRRWREFEQNRGLQHVNIIAMTANAMRGDREKCIAAQMDDYLAKPLTISHLKEMLARWLPGNTLVPQDEVAPLKEVPDDGLLDDAVLSELQQVMGDDFQTVIYSYLQHASQLLTEMKHKAEEGDLDTVMRSAHSFKSSSKNVGAMQLGEEARKLEEQVRAGEDVDLQQAVQSLVISYAKVAKALQDFI